jgi:hypothetical protein
MRELEKGIAAAEHGEFIEEEEMGAHHIGCCRSQPLTEPRALETEKKLSTRLPLIFSHSR